MLLVRIFLAGILSRFRIQPPKGADAVHKKSYYGDIIVDRRGAEKW